MASYVSQDDAFKFFEETLKIASCRERMVSDKGHLLHDICRAFLNTVPFHNLDLLKLPLEERTTPTVAQNVHWVLSGFGGLCWTLNSALHSLLDAIGYDVMIAIAKTFNHNIEDHVVVVAKNVRCHGDHYVVDVGYVNPFFVPVCLDFPVESQTFELSTRIYKYVRRADEYVLRIKKQGVLNSSGDPSIIIGNTENWHDAYSFRIENTPLEILTRHMTNNVYHSAEIVFHRSLRACRFVDDQLIVVKDAELWRERSDHRIEVSPLSPDGDILEAVSQYFPEIPSSMVQDAFRNWRAVSGQTRQK